MQQNLSDTKEGTTDTCNKHGFKTKMFSKKRGGTTIKKKKIVPINCI